MERFKIIIIVLLFMGIFTACEKKYTTENKSVVKDAPIMAVEGGTEIVLPAGEEYTDPGCKATSKEGEDLPIVTSIKGLYFGYQNEVHIADPDLYEVTYTGSYSGVTSTATRQVWVTPPGTDLATGKIQGLYKAQVTRTGGGPDKKATTRVIIVENEPNKYTVVGATGAWYFLWYGYTPANNYVAKFDVEYDAGAYTCGTTNIPNWAGRFPTITVNSFTVDPAAKTIEWVTTGFHIFTFKVKLTLVE